MVVREAVSCKSRYGRTLTLADELSRGLLTDVFTMIDINYQSQGSKGQLLTVESHGLTRL